VNSCTSAERGRPVSPVMAKLVLNGVSTSQVTDRPVRSSVQNGIDSCSARLAGS